jgi:hypothetical protein
MGSIIGWVRATRGWVRSPFGDLPLLRADDAMAHQTWLILAGGMALLLSRASSAELEERFVATRKVYAIARARLEKKRLPKPDAALLRDALHEIANLADPMTKEAGRECLARVVERGARKGGAPSTVSSNPPASTQSAAASLTTGQAPLAPAAGAAGEPAEPEHEETRLDLDLLFERSNKLRGTVATKRSTPHGQDN